MVKSKSKSRSKSKSKSSYKNFFTDDNYNIIIFLGILAIIVIISFLLYRHHKKSIEAQKHDNDTAYDTAYDTSYDTEYDTEDHTHEDTPIPYEDDNPYDTQEDNPYGTDTNPHDSTENISHEVHNNPYNLSGDEGYHDHQGQKQTNTISIY